MADSDFKYDPFVNSEGKKMTPMVKAGFILSQGAMAFGEGLTGKPFHSNFVDMQKADMQTKFNAWKENQDKQLEMAKLGYSQSNIPKESFDRLSPGNPPPDGQYLTMGDKLYRQNPGLIKNIASIKNKDNKDVLNRLPPEQQIAAWQIAREVGGTRSAEKMVNTVASAMEQGLGRDQIEDNLRYSSQSSKFNKEVRNAAQTISIRTPESIRNADFDALDDYVQKGDIVGTQGYLKRLAIKNSTGEQSNRIMEKERTLDFINEIQGDLNTLEKNGVPTGFFRGNYENIISKLGQVNNPEMRKVAGKIATALMSYRRGMTGFQFTEAESKEYKKIFPDINKVGDFNKANIDALTETFGGDLDKFYSQSMGEENYKKIFDKKNGSKVNSEFNKTTSSGLKYKVE